MEWLTKGLGLADFIQSGVPRVGGSSRSNSSSPWFGQLSQSDAEVAKAHNDRGAVSASQGEHDQALEHYFKSLEVSLKVQRVGRRV